MLLTRSWTLFELSCRRGRWPLTVSSQVCALLTMSEEIQKGLKALDLMKIIEGKQALGRKEATKNLGEHKVSSAS